MSKPIKERIEDHFFHVSLSELPKEPIKDLTGEFQDFHESGAKFGIELGVDLVIDVLNKNKAAYRSCGCNENLSFWLEENKAEILANEGL